MHTQNFKFRLSNWGGPAYSSGDATSFPEYLFGKSRTVRIKEIGNTKGPDAISPNL